MESPKSKGRSELTEPDTDRRGCALSNPQDVSNLVHFAFSRSVTPASGLHTYWSLNDFLIYPVLTRT